MTYTIAMFGDFLVATAVDGDEGMMASRLAEMDTQLDGDWRSQLVFYSGLTLFRSEDDIPEGAEVIYSGTDCGWLEDADGRMEYTAAARVGEI